MSSANNSKRTMSARIGRLDDATLSYYRNVSENLVDLDDKNYQEKELFLNNVFIQMTEDWMRICRNQTVSHIVENLLQFGSEQNYHKLIAASCKDWELMCTDRFACHVLQTLILYSAKYIHPPKGISAKKGDSNNKTFSEMFYDLCQFLGSNLGYFMQHTYASHIVRTMLEVLGGIHVSENVTRSKLSRTHQAKKITNSDETLPQPSKDSLNLLHNVSSNIIEFPKLSEHATHSLSGPVLQAMLLVLHKVDQSESDNICSRLIKKTSMFTVHENELPTIMKDEVGSHLVEQVLQVLSPKLFDGIFEEKLCPQLLKIASDSTAQYVAQRLIICVHSKKQFECAFKKLSHHIEDLLALYHIGIIVTLAEGCVRFGTKQDKFIKAMQKAFHCYEPAERQIKFVPLLAALISYEVFYKLPEEKKDEEQESASDEESQLKIKVPVLEKVNLHGSLILQQMLKFANPKMIVSSLLEMKISELKTLSCDPKGSHVVEAFFSSDSVGLKSKELFLKRVKTVLHEITCDKSGSRIIDAIWATATKKQKHSIAEELLKHETWIQGDKFGFYVWRNLCMNQYKHQRSEWENIQTQSPKRKRMFDDIIGLGETWPGGKKKK